MVYKPIKEKLEFISILSMCMEAVEDLEIKYNFHSIVFRKPMDTDKIARFMSFMEKTWHVIDREHESGNIKDSEYELFLVTSQGIYRGLVHNLSSNQ